MREPPIGPGPPGAADHFLVVLFLLGIYLGVAARLPGNIPVPAVIAGVAGLILLVKHARRITTHHIVVVIAVVTVYAASVLSAPDYRFLGERFKGLVQIGYSIVIAYGFYLVAMGYDRARLGRIFFALCVVLLIGSTLENYFAPMRDISDAFRTRAFESGVYVADIRDQMFYGRVRPKLFTSEPSALAFAYTLFAFVWYVLSRWHLKAAGYLALLAAGYFLMRSPTLFLGVLLVPLYEILVAARAGPANPRRATGPRIVVAFGLGAVLVLAAGVFGAELLKDRIESIVSGHDLSFFGRLVAPILTVVAVVGEHPLTGAGLTGWEFIDGTVRQIYSSAPGLASDFRFDSAAHALTNYFWLHWIFLGLFWGCVAIAALTWFLRALGAPSALFCWGVWIVFGQASGGYVDPRTWIVLFLACAASVLHERPAFAPIPVGRPRRPISDARFTAMGST